ncbi:MAG: SDR family NAD(P)-dependent oxidoreductase [Bryobacteraceae bacterium]
MNHSFENQTGLVTGAGSGIGLATARAFAEAGAAVALIDIDENAIGSAAEQLRSAGHKAIALRCDVSDEDAVAAIVHQTISKFGQLDFAFNNAGIQVPVAETADARGEDFDRLMAINLRGVWACMKHELRHMREQASGAIVNCSSTSGLVGVAGLGAYTASKHGVIGLTKSAALEYAARGIRINAICPGAIDTPMVADALANEPETMKAVMKEIPLGRLGSSEEIASAVLWLCSPDAGFMVGQVIVPDGGYTAR